MNFDTRIFTFFLMSVEMGEFGIMEQIWDDKSNSCKDCSGEGYLSQKVDTVVGESVVCVDTGSRQGSVESVDMGDIMEETEEEEREEEEQSTVGEVGENTRGEGDEGGEGSEEEVEGEEGEEI